MGTKDSEAKEEEEDVGSGSSEPARADEGATGS